MLIGITPVMPGLLITVCVKVWNTGAGKKVLPFGYHGTLVFTLCSLYRDAKLFIAAKAEQKNGRRHPPPIRVCNYLNRPDNFFVPAKIKQKN